LRLALVTAPIKLYAAAQASSRVRQPSLARRRDAGGIQGVGPPRSPTDLKSWNLARAELV
jgi:hypothetical protein